MRSRAWFATAAVCAVLTTSACSGGGTSSVGAAAQAGAPAAVTTTTAPCTVPARLAGKDLTRLPVTGKLVALTFDAGANAAGVPSILKTLHDKKVRATFFLTGRFVKTFPKKSAHIGADYLVGNHTVSHPDLTTLTDRQVRAEVRTAQQQILAATGQDPRRFFRFPFGARNAHTIALLNSLCYVPFRWTVDTLGWKGTSGGMTAAKVVARVMAGLSPGEIVLMHVGSNPTDGSTLDAKALPTVIDKLRAKGYQLVRLSRIMSAAP